MYDPEMLRWIAICFVLARPASAETPTERARQLLDAQLAALSDPSAFLATLSPDAFVFGNGSFTLARGRHAASVIATLAASPRSPFAVSQTTTLSLSAGGTADVVWWTADVAMQHGGAPSVLGEPVEDWTTARIVELAVATKGRWHVVALAFASTSGASAPGDVLGAPGAGALTALLASPRDLVRGSWDDGASIVFGADAGVGPAAARKILGPIARRAVKLTGAVEVNGNGWGFSAGELEIAADPQARLPAATARVLLFAIRERTRWKLVAIDTATFVPAPLMIDP
jgi:hypothetical protein